MLEKRFLLFLCSVFFMSSVLIQQETRSVVYAKEVSTEKKKVEKETNVTVSGPFDSASLALFPHNNQGKQYKDWEKESEVRVSIRNIPVTLTKGKKGVSIYVPKNKLSDGEYKFTLSIGNSNRNNIARGFSISIKNGKLEKNQGKEYKDGYMIDVVMDYEEEKTCNPCEFTVTLYTTAVNAEDCFYIGNMWYEDEKTGRYELDLQNKKLEFSSKSYDDTLKVFDSASLAVFPHNNKGKQYKDWEKESEIGVSIRNIPVTLTKGKKGVSIYVPKNKLSDGEYKLQLSIGNSDRNTLSLLRTFSIENGLLVESDRWKEYADGYVAEIVMNYEEETPCSSCVFTVRVSSTTVKEENCFYIGNMWYEDEKTGRYELDFQNEQLEFSSKRYDTSEARSVYISPSLQTTKKELVLVSSNSIEDLEAFRSPSLAVFLHDNQGKPYTDWKKESKITVSILDIPVTLTKGRRGVSICIPKNKLSDGEYELHLNLENDSVFHVHHFSIKNGKLETSSFAYTEYAEGYVTELVIDYVDKGICEHYLILLQLCTTAVNSENCIYVGNIWYEDEKMGRYELNLEDERLAISSIDFNTSEENPIYISYSVPAPKEALVRINSVVLIEKEEMMVGDSYTFLPKDYLNKEGNFIWLSSNPLVGKIEQRTGKFTALKEGKTTIHLMNKKLNLHHTFEVMVSKPKQKDVKDYITVVGNDLISKELEQEVTEFLYDVYPVIYHSFANDEYEKITCSFTYFTQEQKNRGEVGYEYSNQIYINVEYIRKNPQDLNAIMIHELTHSAQHYPNYPVWLKEGIAEYGYYISGYYDEQTCGALEPYREGLHYTDGYRITANFLKYVVECHNKDTVTILNECLKHDVYYADIWEYCTGYTVDELWELYAIYSENSIY